MPVILKLEDGTAVRLDRGLYESQVAKQINDGRGEGKLLEFQDDNTPSRTIHVDPDRVALIYHDGFNY